MDESDKFPETNRCFSPGDGVVLKVNEVGGLLGPLTPPDPDPAGELTLSIGLGLAGRLDHDPAGLDVVEFESGLLALGLTSVNRRAIKGARRSSPDVPFSAILKVTIKSVEFACSKYFNYLHNYVFSHCH